ncbi:deoxyribonuclease V [Ectothiorhodospira shaposhnikovii]|uniref:deoxyribonuclease V n=1 Tax=Ectothiorhodospira shaposhnikovii TaxID=1054 RepID=UPI001EE7C724|nr:deoxyribonuclease V [Ectothiorhodospira shaposhnikovii]MCG5513109.1 deoxyribonuclease V [Ectothiorhodospira shaposhnikovii]
MVAWVETDVGGVSHHWDLTPAQARDLQASLAPRVIREDRLGPLRHVAGVDVGFEDEGRLTRAVVSVLTWPDMVPLEDALARVPTVFPYVPGLLSFREIPAVLEALARLSVTPDLLFCDGQGIAHPRRMGVAAHLGVLTGLPALGVGKSRLTGRFEMPGEQRGDGSPLMADDEVIGRVLRTRTGVKPVFVSIGHRVCLETACRLVLEAAPRYRLPEPIRRADRLASRRDR